MMIDKDRIDREQLRREEQGRRQLARLVQQLRAELGPGERLGAPFRTAIGIVIPIEPAAAPEAGGREEPGPR